MKIPTAILAVGTVISFIVCLVQGNAANAYVFDRSQAADAANAAAASNVALTLTGVGLIGLLVIWAIWAQLDALHPSTAESAAVLPPVGPPATD